MTCNFRYFFDAGSGTCLWSANEEARAKYEYAVDHHALPVSEATKVMLDGLIARYDTWLDWNNPGGGSRWNDSDRMAFAEAARQGLAALRREMPDCIITDDAA